MRTLALCFSLIAAGLQARPEALSLGAGARFGLGPETFTGSQHLQPQDPSNLFSLLGGQITATREASLGGGFGLYGALGWRKKIELQAELLWSIDSSRSVEDIGFGIKREILYQRHSLEIPLLLKFGWPMALDAKSSLRPYAIGGAWGNHLFAADQRIGLQGTEGRDFEWKGSPAEDWGWCAGLGVEYTQGVAISLEARWREGMKDLDPEGNFEQKARGLQVILNIGI